MSKPRAAPANQLPLFRGAASDTQLAAGAGPPLPKTNAAAKRPKKRYRPWKHAGATLGHIRGDVYWIDRTIDGVRYRLSTARRTAEAALLEYRRFAEDPADYARGTVRRGRAWGDAVRAFLKHKRTVEKRSDKYVRELAGQLERFGNYPGFTSLDSFSQADIAAFIADLVEGKLTGRLVNELDANGKPVIERDPNGNRVIDPKTGKPKNKKVLARHARPREATRNRHLAALKSLMTWARAQNPPLTKNVADTHVPIRQEDRNVRPPEPVEPERWKAVEKHLDERWLAAQRVLLGSGLRWAELARLTSDDIEPRNIIVREAMRGMGRTVPVSSRTIEAAKKLLTLGGVPDDNASQMNHRLAVACRAAGAQRYTARQLRHTFAITCLRNGVDVRMLQEWMGHANLATTMRYIHAVRAEAASIGKTPAPY